MTFGKRVSQIEHAKPKHSSDEIPVRYWVPVLGAVVVGACKPQESASRRMLGKPKRKLTIATTHICIGGALQIRWLIGSEKPMTIVWPTPKTSSPTRRSTFAISE
jgi:hypothetical protein